MRFLLIFLPIFLAACALTHTNDYYTETVSSWRWANAAQLTRIWGPPSQIIALPNGNKEYIYKKELYQNYPAPPITSTVAAVSVPKGKSFVVMQGPDNPSISPAFLLNCTTSFEIDPRHIIVNIRAQGNNCTADKSFVTEKSNPYSRDTHAHHKTH